MFRGCAGLGRCQRGAPVSMPGLLQKPLSAGGILLIKPLGEDSTLHSFYLANSYEYLLCTRSCVTYENTHIRHSCCSQVVFFNSFIA